MKKELDNTKATVRLRKSPYRKEWYLYIESYPVRVTGKETPQRVREYLNRAITPQYGIKVGQPEQRIEVQAINLSET